MERLLAKLAYRKVLDGDGRQRVEFTCLFVNHDYEIRGRYFTLYPDIHDTGYVWREDRKRLAVVAAGLAHANGRKNVMPTDADEGVLY